MQWAHYWVTAPGTSFAMKRLMTPPPSPGALRHLTATTQEDEAKYDYEGNSAPVANLNRAAHESWHFPFRSVAAQANVALRVSVDAVAAGKAHTLILTSKRELWSFGAGSEGQLGHANRKTCVPSRAASHGKHVCLTRCVLPCCRYEDPQFIRAMHGVEVKSISCGAWHSMALTEEGLLYAWGSNRYGQLGFGDKITRDAPSVVPKSGEVAFQQASAGTQHTVMLAKDGMVWVCGRGKHGQLGMGDTSEVCELTHLIKIRRVSVKQVCCGLEHTVLVTHSGDVWTFGRGTHYQLGHGNTKNLNQPTLVDQLVCFWVDNAQAGEFHTLVMTEEQGMLLHAPIRLWQLTVVASCVDVLAFGSGEHGQLGLGQKKKVAKIPTPIPKLVGKDIVKVRSGARHCLAISRTGDSYSWGCGLLGRLGHGNSRHYYVPRNMALIHQYSVERCVGHVVEGSWWLAGVAVNLTLLLACYFAVMPLSFHWRSWRCQLN